VSIETSRGEFRFGSNNFPVQDYYLVRAEKDGDRVVMKTVSKVFDDYVDAYAADCTM
jgi:branched-chain amino acid transport system substrate-binding protein